MYLLEQYFCTSDTTGVVDIQVYVKKFPPPEDKHRSAMMFGLQWMYFVPQVIIFYFENATGKPVFFIDIDTPRNLTRILTLKMDGMHPLKKSIQPQTTNSLKKKTPLPDVVTSVDYLWLSWGKYKMLYYRGSFNVGYRILFIQREVVYSNATYSRRRSKSRRK